MSREQSLELRVLELMATIRRLEAQVETSEAAGELILAASRRIIELTGERDRAIAVAVRLEQELAEVEDSLGYPTDVILAPFRGETSAALDVPPESSWSP
jgi:hypothetical protein